MSLERSPLVAPSYPLGFVRDSIAMGWVTIYQNDLLPGTGSSLLGIRGTFSLA